MKLKKNVIYKTKSLGLNETFYLIVKMIKEEEVTLVLYRESEEPLAIKTCQSYFSDLDIREVRDKKLIAKLALKGLY